MKRVLMFTPYFLPRRRVGAMRPFRFVIHLRECGWEPVVLTIAAKGQQLTPREAELLEGIQIIELNPPFDRTLSSESQLKPYQAGQKKTKLKIKKNRNFLTKLDRHLPVDSWIFFYILQYNKIVNLVEEIDPDVVYGTGDPWSGLLVPQWLAKRFKIPFVADFRDPWTLCKVRMHDRFSPSIALDKYFERKIVETANVVLFQAGKTEEKYKAHYAKQVKSTQTIYNSYDLALMKNSKTEEKIKQDSRLKIGFFGKFRLMSPAKIIIDVLSDIKTNQGEIYKNIHVFSYGPLNEVDQKHASAGGVSAQFHQCDAVPLELASAELQKYDILFLSTDPRRDEIIPAKLFEYFSAGKPILSLSPNPEVGELLARSGAGIQFKISDKVEIATLLAKCAIEKQSGKLISFPADPQPEKIKQFEARETTRELAELFDKLLPSHG